MRGFSRIGLLAGAIASAAISVDPTFPTPTASVKRPRPMVRGRHHNRTTYFPAGLNGKKAVARRLRQIQAGSLKAENGLTA